MERLGYLLGRPDGALGEDLAAEEPDLADAVAALDSPRSAVRAAVAAAPEIARQQQLLLSGEATLETRRADRWPQLEAIGRVTRNGEQFGDWDAEQDSYLVGLTLSWDLFDGGLRESRVREARRELDARRMELSDAERRVSLRAREAWRALRDARQARVVAEKRLAYHRAAHEERELGHERGRASFQDLLEAESDVAASRLAVSRAELLVKRAAAELMDAAGLWDAWLDAPPQPTP